MKDKILLEKKIPKKKKLVASEDYILEDKMTSKEDASLKVNYFQPRLCFDIVIRVPDTLVSGIKMAPMSDPLHRRLEGHKAKELMATCVATIPKLVAPTGDTTKRKRNDTQDPSPTLKKKSDPIDA